MTPIHESAGPRGNGFHAGRKTVIIELDFTYTPNEEDVYVYLKELIEDRSLSWETKPQSP
jgi:hypothetical protein